MSVPLKPELLAQLEAFFNTCMINPSLLNQPEYSFIKTFIEFFGGRIPKTNQQSSNESSKKSEDANASKEPEPESKPEPESEESDIDLDMSGVIGKSLFKIVS